jgi:hypothetical protein
MSLLSNNKITEIFYSVDESCKEFAQIIRENRLLAIGDEKNIAIAGTKCPTVK